MGAQERAAAAIARMERVRRELAERRELRYRNAKAVQERSLAGVRQLGPEFEQVAKQLGEVARRRQKAGGWATERIDRENSNVMSFGPLAETPPAPYYPPPAVAPPRAPAKDEPAKPAPTERRRRPAAPAPPDDDDFFDRDTWMVNR
ncbi:MAG TPA: hypothetical protein VGX25_35520 [Actinophytocola sp.]|uniref:hypothetical protein n=1 Tax=Actinophytocola sp. TaxID=1872138 RepID=UPI002DDCA28A|nr:hypothetical protein [Actinophytocola sp.]HEV2784725.1 hypothetical protein [Actinophytocola sp.]